MAKAKKRKSRKVGALSFAPGGMLVKVAAIAAGYLILADPINKELDKLFKKSPDTPPAPPATTAGFMDNIDIVGVGEAGIGALLLFMGRPSMLKTIAGGVLLGAGVKKLTDKSAVGGYQSVPVIGSRRRVAGYQSVPVIGNTPAQLAGTPAQLQGYRVNGYKPNGSGVMGRVGSSEIRDTAGGGIAVGSNAGYMR